MIKIVKNNNNFGDYNLQISINIVEREQNTRLISTTNPLLFSPHLFTKLLIHIYHSIHHTTRSFPTIKVTASSL